MKSVGAMVHAPGHPTPSFGPHSVQAPSNCQPEDFEGVVVHLTGLPRIDTWYLWGPPVRARPDSTPGAAPRRPRRPSSLTTRDTGKDRPRPDAPLTFTKRLRPCRGFGLPAARRPKRPAFAVGTPGVPISTGTKHPSIRACVRACQPSVSLTMKVLPVGDPMNVARCCFL